MSLGALIHLILSYLSNTSEEGVLPNDEMGKLKQKKKWYLNRHRSNRFSILFSPPLPMFSIGRKLEWFSPCIATALFHGHRYVNITKVILRGENGFPLARET